MTSSQEVGDVTGIQVESCEKPTDLEIDSLHKRRRGEPPASLAVNAASTPSDAEGSTPCTAGLTPEDVWIDYDSTPDPENICDVIIKKLQDRTDILSKRGKNLATSTKNTFDALDNLEKILELVDQIVTLKEKNIEILRKLRDINQLKQMHDANKKIILDSKRLKAECKELQMINEVLDSDFDADYAQGEALLESILTGTRSLKRTGSKWRSHSKFGGSLLRKQRSRSAGGDDSDVPMTPLRRRSEGISCKEVDKSKVSKWTRVKAAFRWEKAQQWPPPMGSGIAGAAGAVAAGALVGAVALAGSAPTQNNASTEPPRDSASLTPGSLLSLTPNSSCEELRLDSGSCRKSSVLRCEDVDNFLHAPTQDDSSTSPSPNKLHKSAWGKMRDIIHTRRESVRKKASRSTKSSPDVVPARRRSFSDGGDSDAPPALTLTIPSSEELESEASHPLLRKQRSLELGASRPPQHRSPRASKWSKVKRAFLTSASASVPSSPNRHSAFFTDAETEGLSSGCEASAVRDEIARDYAALQSRLGREFSDRRGKLYAASRPVATEEQLSTDFRKKLAEWQKMKGGTTRQPPPIPARKDLSEDFLKKWDEWKRMKETNSVPVWGEEVKPEEVQVQTSTGLFKFQGISRSFTRKLHEWEKSRGIAPEASTSALLQAARTHSSRTPPPQLTRTQSDGSVAPSAAGSGRLHASSLSVNDADDFDLDYDRDNNSMDGEDLCDGDSSRGALLVEVEADEICTAAPLMAVSPQHTPQKPIYTYDNVEARLLCETSAAITGTAIVQPNSAGNVKNSSNVEICKKSSSKSKTTPREQSRSAEKNRRKLVRQPSIEDDAKFIRKSIEEIEKDNASRNNEQNNLQDKIITDDITKYVLKNNNDLASTSTHEISNRNNDYGNNNTKGDDKTNGKKKLKSRARLEREQSKPSESDTELDVDTVTVEIPKRRKRPRKVSEKPRTPPTSIVSDSEGEIYVLKLKAPDEKEGSPEVIVKTTRKIFSPVVRSGESVPRAVIPVDVDDLDDVRSPEQTSRRLINEESKKDHKSFKKIKAQDDVNFKVSGSGDLFEVEEQRPKSRPPLPLSPSSQRRPQPKETAPSIRIMIQRYNMKIKEEEGHTSGASSGTSSPAWRSPALERRRPLDMPVGVNIRNNPFVEREVQKSVSACQLSSKKEPRIDEKRQAKSEITSGTVDGVLKSRSAGAIHPFNCDDDLEEGIPAECDKTQLSKETINHTASTDTIVPDLTLNTPDVKSLKKSEAVNVLRQMSDTAVPNLSKVVIENPAAIFGRSISEVEPPSLSKLECMPVARCSERTKRIREARERFLSSPGPPRIRRHGIGSANDLRPGDRSSRISCESDVAEASYGARTLDDSVLGRSASTGMVNVERETWERVVEVNRRDNRPPRSRFSLARLAAKLRRKDEGGAVSRLCRQSLLVQLKK